METKKYFHSRPIFYCFLTFLLAILTTKFIFAGEIYHIVLVGLIFVMFLCYGVFKRRFLAILLIFLTFLFGMGWYFLGLSTFYGKSYSEQVSVVGRVSDDLVEYSKYTSCVLKNVYINGEKSKNITLTIFKEKNNLNEQKLEIGDVIAFDSKIEQTKLFTLGNFNSYYYRDKTPYSATINENSFAVQAKNQIKSVEAFRLKIKSLLYKAMGEKNGAVSYAVLFGDKTEIDSNIKDVYKNSGIIHILTVSGLHISFLFALLGFLLKKIKVKGWLNFIICAICLLVYAYACNFTPSILRAGIMGLVLTFSKFSGKFYDNLNSLGLAGILILLISPLSGLDLGFLMSFFCVLSIFVISGWLNKYLKRIFPKFVASAFSISIAVEIGILPFLAMMHSNFNALTFFVNLLVIPIFSVVYPILFVSTFVCLILPFLSFMLKLCGYGFDLIYLLASFFGTTKFAIDLKPFDSFAVMFGFVGLFLISGFFMASKKVKTICCLTMFLLSGTFFGLSYLPQLEISSLSYCFEYGKSIVVLTDSKGDSICVDLPTNSEDVFERLKIKKLASSFILQDDYDFEYSRSFDIPNVVRYDNSAGFSEEISSKSGFVSNFEYNYVFEKSNLLGLEINFDQKSVFILEDSAKTVTQLKKIAEKQYDFVLLGNYERYSSYFDEKTYVMTYYQNQYSDCSFQKFGNVQISLKNNKLRRLD